MVVIVIVSGGFTARMAQHLRVVTDEGFPHLIEHEAPVETPETGRFLSSYELRAVSAREMEEEGGLSIVGASESGDWELNPFPPDFPLQSEFLHDRHREMQIVLTEPVGIERTLFSGWPEPSFWEAHREPKNRPPRKSRRQKLSARRR